MIPSRYAGYRDTLILLAINPNRGGIRKTPMLQADIRIPMTAWDLSIPKIREWSG